MIQTAGIPAREPVSRFSREVAWLGLDLQLETLPSGTAPQYEVISDSLIHRLKIEEPHRRRSGLDTDHPVGQVCRSAPSGARHPFNRCLAVSTYVSPTRVGVYVRVRCVYGFVRFWDGPHRPSKDTTA